MFSLPAVALLTSCAVAPSELPAPTVVVCPPLVQYPIADQSAAADELVKVAQVAPHVVKLVEDYGNLRTAVRHCAKGPK